MYKTLFMSEITMVSDLYTYQLLCAHLLLHLKLAAARLWYWSFQEVNAFRV